MSAPREPLLARLLLRLLVRGPESEFVLGDLTEELERISAERGVAEARRWYRRQAFSTVVAWHGRRTPLDAWPREVRWTLRGLARAPAHTLTTLLTLALGIGGAATVGALASSILRPLPFPDSDRLVALWETRAGERRWVAPANYLDWRSTASSLAGMAAHDTRSASITVDGAASRARVAVVSGNFFEVLEMQPVRGRAFDPGFDTRFPRREAVLSNAAWIDAFGGGDAVGRSAVVDDLTYEVVGVMPPGIDFPEAGLFAWLRSPTEAPELRGAPVDVVTLRDAWYFQVLGRLADGATLSGARAEMHGVARRLAEAHPETNRGSGVAVIPLLEQTVDGVGTTLRTLGAAALLLLLAVAVNVTHLTIARATGRAADAAVRASLGATSADLRRGTFVESLVLSVGGGVLGLMAAHFLLAAGRPLATTLPRSGELALRPEVVGATLLAAVAVGAVVGLSAHRRWGADLGAMARIRAGRAPRRRLEGGLVAAQVAAAVAVLAATGLMARSVRSLAAVDLGFDGDGLATFRLALPDAQTRAYEERVARYRAVRGALSALPGVSAVALGAESPLALGARAGVLLDGSEAGRGDPPESGWQPVEPGYFGALGIPLLAGRDLSPSDDHTSADVAVVNEAFVQVVLGGAVAVGRRVTMGLDGHDRPLTIVGVAADTRTAGPAAPPMPVLYRPLAQTTRFGAASLFIAVRSDGSDALDAGILRRVVREVAPGLPVYAEASGEVLALPFRRAQTTLLVVLTVFGVSALGLGLVGVYGVTAQEVGRRRREIGVRLALGAERGRVVAEEIARGLRPVLIGVPVGLAGAVMLGRVLAGLLFGVAAADPPTLGAATVIVVTTVCAALYLPARRAALVDPARATRD